MSTNDPVTPDRGPEAHAGGGSRPERLPVRDPRLSWLPLLGSAAIMTLMLILIIIANYAK